MNFANNAKAQIPFQYELGEYIPPECDIWSPGKSRVLDKSVTSENSIDEPRHPGEFLRTELFEPNNFKVAKVARKIGAARITLSKFLHSHTDLSPEMAYRLGKEFEKHSSKYSARNLMILQNVWDLAKIEKKEQENYKTLEVH